MIILWAPVTGHVVARSNRPGLHDDNDSSMLFSSTSMLATRGLNYIILITVSKITQGLSPHNCAVIKLKCAMIKCSIKLSSLIIKII